jgi:LysM repeat protein
VAFRIGKLEPIKSGFWVAFAVLPSIVLLGQNDAKILLANLKQDLELINREVASLRSEVEMLRRENAQLRVVVDQLTRSQRDGQESGQLLELQNRLQALELSLRQSERARGTTQEEINKKFQQIIEQMNRGFDQVTQSSTSSTQTPTFSSDYPKNGFVHVVEKGETVSSIAQKYKSKVSWIINANQIADPTKVFVGRELFVPQK